MKLVDDHLRERPPRKRNYAADEPMHPMQIAGYRRMTVAEKIDALAEMYRLGRGLATAGVRMRHPDWSDAEIAREVREMMLYGTT